jgi:hypothetical protein
MNAFENVIANPSSVEARRQLANYWMAIGHPQGQLLSRAVGEKAGLPLDRVWDVRDEIRELVEEHGREWAGFLVDCTEAFYYELGMIGNVVLTGEQFVKYGARICASFPILHLGLREPLCLEQVFAMPQLKHISTLFLAGDSGDREAALMAACPYLANLRIGGLGSRITATGMQALATAPSLTSVISLNVTNNPGAHSSVRGHLFTKQINDSVYLLGPAAIPLYNDALDQAAKGYNCETPDWPPSYVDVAWTE